jgi:hypothetical protein
MSGLRDPLRAAATTNSAADAGPTSHSLFIVPTRRGDGFTANIRGRILELEDPTDHCAPTPDDLVVLAVASDLAWFARRFLRSHGLAAGDVNVTAAWHTVTDPPTLADVNVTVTVPAMEEALNAALLAALEERAAPRSLNDPLRVRLHPADV